jgi:hypothetical protein
MDEQKVFHDISTAIFACSRNYVESHWRGKYVPPDADRGSLTMAIEGHFPAGPTTFDLGFDFKTTSGDLTYTFIKKQGYLPASAAWSALEAAIDRCRGEQASPGKG